MPLTRAYRPSAGNLSGSLVYHSRPGSYLRVLSVDVKFETAAYVSKIRSIVQAEQANVESELLELNNLVQEQSESSHRLVPGERRSRMLAWNAGRMILLSS